MYRDSDTSERERREVPTETTQVHAMLMSAVILLPLVCCSVLCAVSFRTALCFVHACISVYMLYKTMGAILRKTMGLDDVAGEDDLNKAEMT